jgi:transcriptional regulator of arginine metabolism
MRLRVKPTKKQSRQDMIMRLIKEQRVETQDDLQKLLIRHNFKVTQSSLSRDITELGLVKQHGAYVIPPRGLQGVPTIVSIQSAGSNLLVLKTIVGMAAAVGIMVDNSKLPNVVGTIAGDDTVFLATSHSGSHETLKKAINKLFKGE